MRMSLPERGKSTKTSAVPACSRLFGYRRRQREPIPLLPTHQPRTSVVAVATTVTTFRSRKHTVLVLMAINIDGQLAHKRLVHQFACRGMVAAKPKNHRLLSALPNQPSAALTNQPRQHKESTP